MKQFSSILFNFLSPDCRIHFIHDDSYCRNQLESEVFIMERGAAALGGFFFTGAIGYAAYNMSYTGKNTLSNKKKQERGESIKLTELQRHAIFDSKAKRWDGQVRVQELMSGFRNLRRRLIQEAEGDVLEIACGTGRNMKWYNAARVTSLTLTDFSRNMLLVAKDKTKQCAPIPVKTKLANCYKLDFPDKSFDTIVDSFGICSFEKPVESLKEMARVCKDDGKILLLEHGAPYHKYATVRRYLDNTVEMQVEKWGCYCNRDIVRLVKQAGMEIETEARRHFGTTYLLICKPRASVKVEDPESIKSENDAPTMFQKIRDMIQTPFAPVTCDSAVHADGCCGHDHGNGHDHAH